MRWSLDLGTTNSGLARWDDARERAELFELGAICRKPDADDPLEAPRMVPSAVHMLEQNDWLTKVGRWPWVERKVLLGKQALIGREALDRNQSEIHPAFCEAFKTQLAQTPTFPLARVGSRSYSAREVARTFLRELFVAVDRAGGGRIRDLTVTVPVDSYEGYRAELQAIGQSLGVKKLRFVDEPVAAAVGYGLTIQSERVVLVVDMGAGTLNMALVAMNARDAGEQGRSTVLGKAGRRFGGNLVDQWLLARFCEDLGYVLSDSGEDAFWYRLMLAEARGVKEALFFKERAGFFLKPPENLRRGPPKRGGDELPYLEVTRADLEAILTGHGLYESFHACVAECLAQAKLPESAIEDVLMTGGSTLLPKVYSTFEERFGRDRVRAWQPFEAVVLGGCAYAARGVETLDFIVHDYALVVYDARTNERQYSVIVPRGTRYPTSQEVWRRQMVPTCSLGEPEEIFKLVVCEVGRAKEGERQFFWDAHGNLHKLGGANRDGAPDDGNLVVPLNEANPVIGRLAPPHPPADRKPRLDIAFGVNESRWLCARVKDLKTGRMLMDGEPVVRLL
jgi:molecular chaperone DnaK (HSP70)